MPHYKVVFFDGTKEINQAEVVADSVKHAVREGCRICKLDYPAKYNAKVSILGTKTEEKPKKEAKANNSG